MAWATGLVPCSHHAGQLTFPLIRCMFVARRQWVAAARRDFVGQCQLPENGNSSRTRSNSPTIRPVSAARALQKVETMPEVFISPSAAGQSPEQDHRHAPDASPGGGATLKDAADALACSQSSGARREARVHQLRLDAMRYERARMARFRNATFEVAHPSLVGTDGAALVAALRPPAVAVHGFRQPSAPRWRPACHSASSASTRRCAARATQRFWRRRPSLYGIGVAFNVFDAPTFQACLDAG